MSANTTPPSLPLDYANLDFGRAKRVGFPETIYGLGKTPEQIAGIFARLCDAHPRVLCTRCSPAAAKLSLVDVPQAQYDEVSQVLYRADLSEISLPGSVAIVTAGTSDLPVATEALRCAQVFGCQTDLIVDVGVAGLDRLLRQLDRLRAASVVICVAGMEAALPSVVGGLVERPVIAVPTSVGYGASFGGLAALLGCINACSSGITTVNIDNGYGAAYSAASILRLAASMQGSGDHSRNV